VAETAYDFLTSKRNVPKNSGKVVYFTRQTAFTPTSASLTEGTTPAVTAFTAATVSATLAGYGHYADFSDLFELTTIDANLKEKVSTFGQFAAEKMDLVRLNKMVAGATTLFPNGKTPAAANPLTALLSTDTLDVGDLRRVVLTSRSRRTRRRSSKPPSVPSTRVEPTAASCPHKAIMTFWATAPRARLPRST
jgi:N4-gp56 family major capsid protein